MIKIYDQLIPEDLVYKGYQHFKNYIYWDKLSDSPSTYVNASEGKIFNNLFEDIAYEFIQYLDVKKFKKCLYNSFSYGDCPKPHIDSYSKTGLTYLIYMNPFWKIEWSGETVFIGDDNEIITSIMPKMGRVIKFNSNIIHCARPPVKDAIEKRYSLVFQTEPVEEYSIKDLF